MFGIDARFVRTRIPKNMHVNLTGNVRHVKLFYPRDIYERFGRLLYFRVKKCYPYLDQVYLDILRISDDFKL